MKILVHKTNETEKSQSIFGHGEGFLREWQDKPQKPQGFFSPGMLASATPDIWGLVKIIRIHVPPVINLKVNEEIVQATCPFDTISIEDFKKKYLPHINEEEMWIQFKTDLWDEVEERKISKIKYYRIINKLTQIRLAEMIQTKQPNIARIEKVGYKPAVSLLKKLGKIFKIDYKELLE